MVSPADVPVVLSHASDADLQVWLVAFANLRNDDDPAAAFDQLTGLVAAEQQRRARA